MKIRNWIIAILLVAGTAVAANRSIDYAAEDAAYSTVSALRDAAVEAQRIAVLPLAGDQDGLAALLRSELVRYTDFYEFYVRDDAEWNKLLSEIEFGERRGDVMDASTIQKFGSVKGVDAVLYGSIREASALSNGDGLVRMNLMLADVETGKQIWAGMIEGEYVSLTPPDAKVQRAAVAAAEAAAAEFAQAKERLGEVDVLIFPLAKDRTDFSDIVSTPFIEQSDSSVRFFKDLGLQKGHRKVLNMVKRQEADNPSIPSVLNLLSDLEATGLIAPESASSDGSRKAVLIGRFGELVKDELMTSIPLNLNLVDVKTGQVLWSANVENIGLNVREIGVPLLVNYGKIIAIAIGALIVLGFLTKGMRRPR